MHMYRKDGQRFNSVLHLVSNLTSFSILTVSLLLALCCSACNFVKNETGSGKSLVISPANTAAKKFDHDNAIKVFSAPLAVHTNFFSSNSKLPDVARDPNFEAYTLWYFHCFADFNTEDQQVDDTSGAATAVVKVKSIDLRLSCPVNIWLEKNAPALTREHEDGHVFICGRVYKLAPNVARAAGEKLLGKSYNGMGSTLAQARKMALGKMERDIADIYREKIVEVCDEISNQYDEQCHTDLMRKTPLSQHDIAEQSFRQTLDRPVRYF